MLKPFNRLIGRDKIEEHVHKKNKDGILQKVEFMQMVENFESNRNYKLSYHVKKRKRKTFSIFRIVKNNGTVDKQVKTVSLKQFKKRFKLNRTNKIVGFTPDYIGFRRSQPVKTKNYIDDILHTVSHDKLFSMCDDRIYDSFLKSRNNFRVVYQGSPDSNGGHMTNFLKDNSKSKYSVGKILEICQKCPWFKFPKLDFTNISELEWIVNFNPNASPGHYTSLLTGGDKKGYTIFGAVYLAKQLYNHIRQVPTKNYCLWDVFAREKDIKVDEKTLESEVSTRVVLNPEHYVTHLLSWIYQKFMIASENDESNYYIRGEMDGEKARKILERFSKYCFISNPDFTLFDSSIDTEYLIAAGLLMFSNSINTKEDMRMFFYVVMASVTKYVALPPGVVVELNRGNPSGSPGVTAINCVVNMIRWAIVGYEIYGEEYWKFMDVIVYGDDTYLGLSDHSKIFEIDSILQKHHFYGDKVKDLLFPGALIESNAYKDSPDYLKRHFDLTGIYWNTKKIFDRLLYQTKKRTQLEQIDVIINYCETAPCDDDFNNFCFNLLKYITPIDDITNSTLKAIKTTFYHRIDNARRRFIPYLGFKNILGSWVTDVKLANFKIAEYLPRYNQSLSIEEWRIIVGIYIATNSPQFLNYLQKHNKLNFSEKLPQINLFNGFKITVFDNKYYKNLFYNLN